MPAVAVKPKTQANLFGIVESFLIDNIAPIFRSYGKGVDYSLLSLLLFYVSVG